jgi:hypothetical protein
MALDGSSMSSAVRLEGAGLEAHDRYGVDIG